MLARFIGAILVGLVLTCAPAITNLATAAEQRAVLVTGASTGIGRNVAERLAAEGHYVYAGARKAADIAALSAIENVQGIRLDVTVQEEIDAAVAHITKEGRGLYGLVNNAGVAVLGPLIEVSEADMQFQMDVNLFGPYRVSKAFAPLIIESHGRITTTGSISGILSNQMLGPYSMSKHAIEAFADTLAVEMEQFGVAVSVIEPGNYNSNILDSLKKRRGENGLSVDDSRYREAIDAINERSSDRSNFKEPDEVSAAVMQFLFEAHPKRRYMVVPNQFEAEITIQKAIAELVQLNERHEYSYDRDELIAFLDAALEISVAN